MTCWQISEGNTTIHFSLDILYFSLAATQEQAWLIPLTMKYEQTAHQVHVEIFHRVIEKFRSATGTTAEVRGHFQTRPCGTWTSVQYSNQAADGAQLETLRPSPALHRTRNGAFVAVLHRKSHLEIWNKIVQPVIDSLFRLKKIRHVHEVKMSWQCTCEQAVH